jgi:NAD(P)-dependent dehydrogenase (short-subunit alcohol dehydrogenase family)
MSTSRPADYLENLFGLKGKAAVVTGGGGAIGPSLCKGLARAGARVAVLTRSEASCTTVAAQIRAEGGDAIPVVADILDVDSLDRARDQVVEAFGGLDILVNNAGGGATPTSRVLPETPLFNNPGLRAGTRAAIDLNLIGPILATFAFGEVLASGDGGVIVNTSSNSARHVGIGVMGYSSAKAGLEQYTRWLAVETAHRYRGRVRVNALGPGFTVGDSNRHRYWEPDGTPTQRTKDAVARIPVGRLGSSDDLVTTLLFLCAPASAYVTGQVVSADGGLGLDTGV